ncbi:serine/threonine-protein kinase [Streptomyces sp. NRRL B-1347]|uniref:serine/threonine-protein kinase n=1 Tax=Streptomyces sp. NRRL B-1347 TaxID=1476877 RepID=UPI0004C68834|nr:serine/threonine-protein kinase [Streptomyces sp. NRRL B-1347]
MRRGTTVGGRYRLVRGPFHGGMGEVWIARDQRLPRQVILKRLRRRDRRGTRSDRREFDRIEAEARALARFSHPHVVTLHDVLTLPEGGFSLPRRRTASWLVMEYVSGGSLADRPPLAPPRAARVGAQVAAALAALHAEGIVHGDVKPGNVVTTPEGLAKLADFGAAYRVGGQETITPPGTLSYTPDYAAPEVVRGRPEPASDVFSLAALLHTLVTGRPPRPHTGGDVDPFVAERQAERGEVALDPGLGPLGDLLPAMLDPAPKNRPAAAEAGRLLARIAGPQEPLPRGDMGGDGEGEGVGQDSESSGRIVLPGRSRQFVIVAAVAVVTLAAAVWLPPLWPDGGDGGDGGDGRRTAPVLGDHRTLDPCALADPAALKRFGEPELDRHYGNFDRCDILVDTGGDDPVDVQFHFDTGGGSGLPQPHRTEGRVAVVKESGDSDECVRTMLPATDRDAHVTIVVEDGGSAAPDARGGAARLCAMADAATRVAVRRLNDGPLARRPEAAPGSLVHEDACALLDARALEAIPGVDARDPDVGFGNWDCEWASTTSDLWLELRFDQGPSPDAGDGTLTRVGGRRAVVEPGAEGPRTCRVRVVHRAHGGGGDGDGGRAVETLNVTVGGDPSQDRLRRLALRLAAAAVAEVR